MIPSIGEKRWKSQWGKTRVSGFEEGRRERGIGKFGKEKCEVEVFTFLVLLEIWRHRIQRGGSSRGKLTVYR